MHKLDYEKVFWTLVSETKKYLLDNNLKAMILGISGGIDSTVTAAICHEVSKQTDIPLIGRSLPIKNLNDEFNVSTLVGKAFCSNFKAVGLNFMARSLFAELSEEEGIQLTPIAKGNIQARLRMMYLYNLASIHNGLVMSTDNQTEYQLGFWTIHGDVGDFDPLQDLWKTEVYELANQILKNYLFQMTSAEEAHMWNVCETYNKMFEAVKKSMELTPTDGLGISNSDLDQIGAKSYAEVDDILQTLIPVKDNAFIFSYAALSDKYGQEVVNKVWKRHLASEFKRKKSPIYIERNKYV